VGKTYYSLWQNPTYPEDQGMSVPEMEAAARAASMARAQSPGPLTCVIDGTWSVDNPFHADDFATCMQYRHQNVVADGAPWTYWQLVDGPLIGPRPPVPPLPVGLLDWQLRTSAGYVPPGVQIPVIPPPPPGSLPRLWAVRAGPVDTDRSMGVSFEGCSIIINVASSVIWPLVAPFATRLTFIGSFTIEHCYIGTNLPGMGYFATTMHPVTFNGGNKGVTVSLDDSGNFIPTVSDDMPFGLDGTNSLWVTFFLDPNGDGILGETTQREWAFFFIPAATLPTADIGSGNEFDLPGVTYVPSMGGAGLFSIEGLYDQSQLVAKPSA
jgi:hypothetical protein